MRQALAAADAGRKSQLAQGELVALQEAREQLAKLAAQQTELKAQLEKASTVEAELRAALGASEEKAVKAAATVEALRSQTTDASEAGARAAELEAALREARAGGDKVRLCTDFRAVG